jgi:hypothetical protein
MSRSGLADDAWHSYLDLLRQVRAVQDLSSKLGKAAHTAANAYHRALTTGSADDWSRLVNAAAAVADYGHEVGALAQLKSNEREAVEYFDAIARENADLLGTSHVAA